jgi:CubicO group peptidase (beta-lactamase class C family)
LILAILVLLVVALPVAAQLVPQTPPPNTTTALAQQGPTDPAELETFLDDFFTEKMEELHIPGAAFVMVKDGETFFSKGYGYADLENQIPVDPEQTIFRIGSVSKLFTATAAMQLVEQGSIDLNSNVNQYIKSFQLPDTYPEPVTPGQSADSHRRL